MKPTLRRVSVMILSQKCQNMHKSEMGSKNALTIPQN